MVKPRVSFDIIKKTILNYDLLDNGRLKRKKDPVWKKICEELGADLIKPINLFFTISQDRHSILTFYKKEKGLDITTNHSPTIDDSCFILINESDIVPKELVPIRIPKNEIILFDIVVTKNEWSEICPIKEVTNDQQVLQQPGWTDLILKKIWKKKKLPCTFTFKSHSVKDTDYFINIEGYCTECQADLYIYCLKEPPPDEKKITFSVSVLDACGIPHIKRKLDDNEPEMQRVKYDLRNRNAKQLKSDVTEFIKYDCESLFLSSRKFSRETTQEVKRKNEDLGIPQDLEIFESLSFLKSRVDFNKFIRQIGYDKFFIFYWSMEQISVHNDIQNHCKHSVCIDTIGSVVLPINRTHGQNCHIFLSALITHVDNIIVPLAFALSERNDTQLYSFFLGDWIKSGATIPAEVVTDMRKPLQNAVCLTFNQMSFKAYNEECINILQGKKTNNLTTQLRTDIAHLMHVVTSWSCFNNKPNKVQQLFKRSVGFLTTVKCVDNFKGCLKAIFRVANSRNYDSVCQKALKYLLKCIKTFDYEEFNTNISQRLIKIQNKEIEEDNNNKYEDSNDQTKSVINNFIQQIITEVENNIMSTSSFQCQTNDYYLPDFVKQMCILCEEFVCWTNVMNSSFENPNEVSKCSGVEPYFSQIREEISDLPARADKFVVKHIRQIDAEVKLAQAVINKINTNEKCKVGLDVNQQLKENCHNKAPAMDINISKIENKYFDDINENKLSSKVTDISNCEEIHSCANNFHDHSYCGLYESVVFLDEDLLKDC